MPDRSRPEGPRSLGGCARWLNEVLTATHPAAKLEHRAKGGGQGEAEPDPPELLARLDDEAEEDGDD